MFTAKFGGICAECEGWIKVGDPARFVDNELTHTSCPIGRDTTRGSAPEFDLRPLGKNESFCHLCGYHHSGEC